MIKKLLIIQYLLILHFTAIGQSDIWYGGPSDSCTFVFNAGEDLLGKCKGPHTYSIDTAGAGVWQIGLTTKSFFADASISRAIMTDTINSYPINADNSFTLSFSGNTYINPIISFWHKYQTSVAHDGGIVEYSQDGKTWYNILGECSDSRSIRVENFYSGTDTLISGEAAFSGTSNGWQNSILQIINYGPGNVCFDESGVIIRFRFKSDDTTETLDGWMIDNILIKQDIFENITAVKQNVLKVFPVPSYNGIVQFPKLRNAEKHTIEITNALGVKIFSMPYKEKINLEGQPVGVYFYKVSSKEAIYTGKILLE